MCFKSQRHASYKGFTGLTERFGFLISYCYLGLSIHRCEKLILSFFKLCFLEVSIQSQQAQANYYWRLVINTITEAKVNRSKLIEQPSVSHKSRVMAGMCGAWLKSKMLLVTPCISYRYQGYVNQFRRICRKLLTTLI